MLVLECVLECREEFDSTEFLRSNFFSSLSLKPENESKFPTVSAQNALLLTETVLQLDSKIFSPLLIFLYSKTLAR